MVQKIPTEQEATDLANELFFENKYPAKAISASAIDKARGQRHYNFEIRTDKKDLVLRILPSGEHPVTGRGDDNYFGGPLTIEREAITMRLARETGAPAPEVIAVADKGEQGKILLVEKMPGILFRDYLDQHNHSFTCFLKGLKSLGETMAKVHSKHFESFGKLEATGTVPGTKTYGEYLETIIQRHFTENPEIINSYYTPRELKEIFDYMEEGIKYAKTELAERRVTPTLIIYDQHSRNFFVDPKIGEVSGLYDVEYGQAAHPNLELGGMALQLFGFYSGKHVKLAREIFMEGYMLEGGSQEIAEPRLEVIHTANHLFSAIKSYHGKKDGLRDTWSKTLSEMVLGIVRAGQVNCYDAFTDMTRTVTRQPKEPTY